MRTHLNGAHSGESPRIIQAVGFLCSHYCVSDRITNALDIVFPEGTILNGPPAHSLNNDPNIASCFASLLSLTAFAQTGSAPMPELRGQWVGTWATAPFAGDPWHEIPTLVGSTLREIVHTSIAGQSLRVHFTNEFGTEPLRIEAASVAISAGEPAIQPGTLHAVTFSGQSTIVIPPGAEAVSDIVDMPTDAFADLSISLYLPLQRISNVSVHSSAAQVNYMQSGNEVSASRLTATVPVPSWFFLKSIEVSLCPLGLPDLFVRARMISVVRLSLSIDSRL
jgi:hypothetical protein